LELAFTGAIATVVAFVVGNVVADHEHHGLTHALATIGPWLVLLAALATALVVPALRARRWRWRLDDHELDLRHGALTDIRTVVPIARIQHVDVRRSVPAQMAGVASVVVHTAAGTTEIPALAEHDATVVRDRIAGLIRTPDDE
jgi:membrane protein YdbS with pleckstrin-like domain